MKKMLWMLVLVCVVMMVSVAGADYYPERCVDCGSHNTVAIDCGEYHRLECGTCGYIVEQAEHGIECTNPTMCAFCGSKTNVDEAPIEIHSAKYCVPFNQYEHSCECACGISWHTESHYSWCGAGLGMDTCSLCYAENVIISKENLNHTIRYVDQGETHIAQCEKCDDFANASEEHVYAEGICTACGHLEYGHLPGDPTGDGEVDVFDALAILQFAVGWGNEIDQTAGDVNDDGACDVFDALLILQYTVGWDVELK